MTPTKEVSRSGWVLRPRLRKSLDHDARDDPLAHSDVGRAPGHTGIGALHHSLGGAGIHVQRIRRVHSQHADLAPYRSVTRPVALSISARGKGSSLSL